MVQLQTFGDAALAILVEGNTVHMGKIEWYPYLIQSSLTLQLPVLSANCKLDIAPPFYNAGGKII